MADSALDIIASRRAQGRTRIAGFGHEPRRDNHARTSEAAVAPRRGADGLAARARDRVLDDRLPGRRLSARAAVRARHAAFEAIAYWAPSDDPERAAGSSVDVADLGRTTCAPLRRARTAARWSTRRSPAGPRRTPNKRDVVVTMQREVATPPALRQCRRRCAARDMSSRASAARARSSKILARPLRAAAPGRTRSKGRAENSRSRGVRRRVAESRRVAAAAGPVFTKPRKATTRPAWPMRSPRDVRNPSPASRSACAAASATGCPTRRTRAAASSTEQSATSPIGEARPSRHQGKISGATSLERPVCAREGRFRGGRSRPADAALEASRSPRPFG